ncbi:hypothetical protein J2847_006430 [Azospirillum agricola]|uniref:terminase n=1 Tax=Azospirillum agricola TaxID=1720247 RepID=UPI001AEAA213|nr:terminase [Azospirillum agricola]MBP2233095.1 hypothetical protein [Azospirillum agricola]
MTKRKDIDWSAIEADYRTGNYSNRALAAKHGVSEAAIRKKAGEAGWVRTGCAPAHHGAHQQDRQPEPEILPPVRPQLPPADGTASSAAAAPVVPVELADHVRELVRRQLHELDTTTSQLDDIEDAIHDETQGDRSGRRRSAMLKAVSLPARSLTLKTIAQVLELLGEAGASKKKVGKKEQRQEAAAEAGRGRYAPRPPPKLVVDNG